MINKHFKSLLTTGCVMAAVVGSASAGGFSRGNADTDILFEPGNFNMRATATIVSPDRTIISGPDNVGHDYADTYVVPSGAVKFKISDNLACAGTVSQPYGGSSSYAVGRLTGAGAPLGKTSESFTITEYGATCAVGFDLSKGRISVLGGIFLENFNYDLSLAGPGATGPVNIDLKGSSPGWRAGVAYEIPEIALRAQVLYRSETIVDSSGTAAGTLFFDPPGAPPPGFYPLTGTAGGTGTLPQSLEIKLQSGVAPGWLAFGSVKWTDWSVNRQLTLATSIGINRPNDYFWRDGWTVSAGVGHAFNEQISGTAFLSWDRGVSTGYDLYADVWTLGTGILLKDALGGELRLGGAVSHLGSVAETAYPVGANYAVGSDWSFAASAGYAVKW